MLKNYFKIAWRNLLRRKAFSIINIFGLAIGIATCLVIMLYVQNELSYDRYNEKADRIVRVVFKGFVGDGGEIKEANVMPPVAATLKRDYPEVLDATRIMGGGVALITYGEKSFKEDEMAFVDANFFDVFTIPLLQGSVKKALVNPRTIVISQETAQKYFGNENPIGKVLDFKTRKSTYTVTGVFDKIPENSHFHFDMLVSMAEVPDAKSQSWMTSNFYTYLVLPKGYDYKKLEAKMPDVVEKYMGPQIQQAFGMSYAQFKQKGNKVGLLLQPLTDIHLHSDLNGDLSPSGDIRYVYIFAAVALFMLLIACINFMNLSTAGASKRAMEVGIRKVMGSVKIELIYQFLIESVLLTMIALLLSIFLVYLALPVFNSITETELSFYKLITNAGLMPGMLLFGIIVGILAGSYPAFFLSSFKPIPVLKGKFTSGKNSIAVRSGLVVFQFVVSIILIVSITVVYKQLSYIQNKKLGYNKDQVLIINGTWALGNKQGAFRDELMQDPRVLNVSTSSFIPAGNTDLNNNAVYPGDKVGQYVYTPEYRIDTAYLNTLGIELVAGRNFSAAFADSASTIINETAAKAFGWKKNAVGKTITGHADNQGHEVTYRIIGVVKDFHFRSLHEPISPVMMVLKNYDGTMIAKVKTSDIRRLLASIKSKWAAEEPFSYSFMDERFNKTYRAEQKTGDILGIFAGLTLFVACMGLFGLAAFTAQQRKKEIGICKVLGATVSDITTLLSVEFLKLVLIALLVACPVA
ncbi:MAG TPA: cell division protein FtsX, partial [Sphingobacteriaceae bacterium]|nr:cell division protein FtsX [Sphingobacteriaceae bacterium]